MPVRNPRRIFISHATRDLPRLRGLIHLLRALGHDVFVASDDIPAGSEWESVLEKSLKESDLVLVLWTENAAQSDWVAREYTMALVDDPERPVIPLHLDEHVPLPKLLARRQAVVIPLVQEMLQERSWVTAEGGDGAAVERVVDEVLHRYRVELPRWQRRDVLLFVGAAASLGLAATLTSFLCRPSMFATQGEKLASVLAGLALGLSLSTSIAERSHGRSAPTPSGLARVPAGGMAVPSQPSTAASATTEPDPAAQQSDPDEQDHATTVSEPIVPARGVCEKARRAVSDLELAVRQPKSRKLPATRSEAIARYAEPFYEDCVVTRIATDPSFELAISCETAFDTPVEALQHYGEVTLGLSACVTPRLWSRRHATTVSDGASTERISRILELRHRNCRDVTMTALTGACLLSSSDHCSKARFVIRGDFLDCLEV